MFAREEGISIFGHPWVVVVGCGLSPDRTVTPFLFTAWGILAGLLGPSPSGRLPAGCFCFSGGMRRWVVRMVGTVGTCGQRGEDTEAGENGVVWAMVFGF